MPGGEFYVGIDAISAIFLLPIFLVSLLGSIYGLGYWKQTEHAENGRKLRLFYGTLTAGMALLVIARNGVLFLFGWEIMALSAFFLVTTEDRVPEVRQSGWIYLVATHVATLCLFALFALLRAASGSFTLVALQRRCADAGHGHGDLRLRAGRLRLEGRHHALARLAARRPRQRAEPRLGHHVGRDPQDGDLRAGPRARRCCRRRRWPGATWCWGWESSRACWAWPLPSASTI